MKLVWFNKHLLNNHKKKVITVVFSKNYHKLIKVKEQMSINRFNKKLDKFKKNKFCKKSNKNYWMKLLRKLRSCRNKMKTKYLQSQWWEEKNDLLF